MTIQECIGQTLCIGFPGTALTDEVRAFVKENKIGNFILFSHNIESLAQIAALTAEIQDLVLKHTGCPAFITIDQEGGVVQRLPKELALIPGAMAVAAAGDVSNAYDMGVLTALELKQMGANLNLAPCVDVNSNPQNPVIGVRSYGSDPESVAQYALAMIRGMQDGGVLACVKHFPGHGDTAVDSHIGLPVVEQAYETLEKTALLPFKRAIDAGVTCVMSSHIVFPRLEPSGLPATLSKTILTDILRGKLGFQGLILTDCLEMGAIQAHYGTANGACMAIEAGADLAFISHSLALAGEAVAQITRKAKADPAFAVRLSDAATHVQKAKKAAAARQAYEKDGPALVQKAKAVREKSLTLFKGDIHPPTCQTVFMGSLAYRSTLASSAVDQETSFPREMAEAFHAVAIETPVNPDVKEISTYAQRVQGADVVFGLYNGQFNQGQLALIRALCDAGCRVTAIALRSPYDLRELPSGVTAIAAYEYTHEVFNALARLLKGELSAQGTVLF